jgi:hypothetical protein
LYLFYDYSPFLVRKTEPLPFGPGVEIGTRLFNVAQRLEGHLERVLPERRGIIIRCSDGVLRGFYDLTDKEVAAWRPGLSAWDRLG